MLYQPRCAGGSQRGVRELDIDENSGSYNFVSKLRSGKLALFVNDSYVTCGNNLGYANIAMPRVN